MFVCNVLFCFVLLPIVKIVLMQICFRKPENVYYEYCSSANKNIKKKNNWIDLNSRRDTLSGGLITMSYLRMYGCNEMTTSAWAKGREYFPSVSSMLMKRVGQLYSLIL